MSSRGGEQIGLQLNLWKLEDEYERRTSGGRKNRFQGIGMHRHPLPRPPTWNLPYTNKKPKMDSESKEMLALSVRKTPKKQAQRPCIGTIGDLGPYPIDCNEPIPIVHLKEGERLEDLDFLHPEQVRRNRNAGKSTSQGDSAILRSLLTKDKNEESPSNAEAGLMASGETVDLSPQTTEEASINDNSKDDSKAIDLGAPLEEDEFTEALESARQESMIRPLKVSLGLLSQSRTEAIKKALELEIARENARAVPEDNVEGEMGTSSATIENSEAAGNQEFDKKVATEVSDDNSVKTQTDEEAFYPMTQDMLDADANNDETTQQEVSAQQPTEPTVRPAEGANVEACKVLRSGKCYSAVSYNKKGTASLINIHPPSEVDTPQMPRIH